MALRDFSKEALMSLLKSRVESAKGAPEQHKEELREYLEVSFDRFLETLELVKKYRAREKGKVLEIGPFPFFMTTALLEFGDDEIATVSAPEGIWPGEDYQVAERQASVKAGGKEYRFPCWAVNVEKDRMPFSDGSFDTILCAEILEHLVHDPAAMICEIGRVLKPGGFLILTTPNGLYWKHVYNLFFYSSWEPYSKYGAYGRHNRLWAPNEVEDLLKGNGFEVVSSTCAYAHSRAKTLQFACKKKVSFVNLLQDMALILFNLAVKIPIPLLKKKDGDQLYVVAKKVGEPKAYTPGYLRRVNFIYEPK